MRKKDKRIVFIAETITDIGKAIFAVGLASYFFEKLPLFWRFTAIFSSALIIIGGIIIYPKEGGR